MASFSAICLFLAAFLALSLRPLMSVGLEDPCSSLPSIPRAKELEEANNHCSNEHSRLKHHSSEALKYQCADSETAECTRYETREGVEHRCTVIVQNPPRMACLLGRLFNRITIRSCITYFRFGVTVNSPLDVLERKYLEDSAKTDGSLYYIEAQGRYSAAYSITGRRYSMEDRFVLKENVPGKEIAYFAVFDGHGGESAADYAQANLLKNLLAKIDERSPSQGSPNRSPEKTTRVSSRFSSYRTQRPIVIESEPDYQQILNDAILSTDEALMNESAETPGSKPGSTALVALIAGSRLFVANVGDSRGVMCDSKGRTVPLSFDHKPNLRSERSRIEANGGLVVYQLGAWRLDGHLAISRVLGNDPEDKSRGKLIAKPDILSFELSRHKPRFLVLATDGLWDVLSNDEVVAFLTASRLRETHLGAKSLAYYAFLRGSTDNITVVVIDLRSKEWVCSGRGGNGECSPSSRPLTSSSRGGTRDRGKRSAARSSVKK